MKIRNYIALLFCAALIASCGKDFSERTSYDGEDSFRFLNSTSTTIENAGTVSIPVIFTTTSGASGNVSVTGSSETLQEGVDYTIVTSTLSLGPDTDFRGNVEVMLIDNEDVTPAARELVLTLTNPSTGDVGFSGPDNINSSYTLVVNENDCPAIDDISGTYNVNATGTSTDGCCPDPADITGTVDITDNGDGTYTIFDWTGGLYGFWYEIYGITPEFVDGGGLSVVLNYDGTVIESGEFTEPFGSPATVTGSIDVCTGIITYDWTNGFADTGSITLTK